MVRLLTNDDSFEISALTGVKKVPIFNDAFIGYGFFVNDKLVSVAFLSCFSIFPNPETERGKVGEISGVYTKPEYRQEGFARKCIEKLISVAKDKGIDYIGIDSVMSAKFFYERLGFFYMEDEKRMFLRL